MRVAAYNSAQNQLSSKPDHFISSSLASQLSSLIVSRQPAVTFIQFEYRASGIRILSVTLSNIEPLRKLKDRFRQSRAAVKISRPGRRLDELQSGLGLGYPHKDRIVSGFGIARKGCVAISEAALAESHADVYRGDV